MYCSNCGMQIPDDSRFCPECGEKIEDNFVQTNKEPSKAQTQKPELPPKQSPKRNASLSKDVNKRNTWLCIIGGCVVAIGLIIVIISMVIKPSINLNKYVKISFEGYDTVGKAVCEFDIDKFQSDYEKKLNDSAIHLILSNIEGLLSKDSGLSNGDKVVYSWNCDDEYIFTAFGYKLKYKDIELEVKDLLIVKTFDPFTGIDVVFEGVDPNGTASVQGRSTEDVEGVLDFELSTSGGLSNGDTVTVKIVSYYYGDPIEQCIDTYGMIPSPMEKTFTVTGLNSNVRTSSESSEDTLLDMEDTAQDSAVQSGKNSVESQVGIQGNAQEQEAEELGIIFPNSSSEIISTQAIQALSDEELRYAINELYARNGYIFKNEELGQFYSKYDWYKGTVKADDFSGELFNSVEKENLESLMQERRNRKK